MNFVFMRLARDISRAKSRQRRFNQRYALVPVLLGSEEPLPLGDPDGCVGCIALTRDELADYDGRQLADSGEAAPLLLSILGRIYDVSGGKAFYGPGKAYHKLVGKDASRAFCTGCLEPACLISSLQGLSPEQRREADKWVELYEWHDKYKLVGRLRVDPLAPEEEEFLLSEAQEVEARRSYKPFRRR
jgi:predicted heme/steroid binding protein